MLATFLFEAANFLLLAGGLGWVVFRPIRAALDAERASHEKWSDEAKRLRSEAESLSAESRSAREALDAELARERAEGVAAAQREAARILDEARGAQAAERRALERELAVARETQTAALVESLARVAADSVRGLLASLDGPALDLALVRAACAALRDVPEAARRSALVETARPLDGEARRLVAEVLGDRFEERTVGELGAGVRVATSAGQVDASALSVARQASRALREALSAADAPADAERVPHA